MDQLRSARSAAVSCAALVAVAHLAMEAPRLGRQNLWLDEAVSVHLAQLGPAPLLAAVKRDTNPPLYYLLLSGWQRLFGDSEAAVRWPSVIATALTGAVLFLAARRAGGWFAAWCASGLFLFSSAILQFSHQARPYALAMLLATVALAALLRVLEAPTWPRILLLAAANVLALFTHYLVALAVAAQVIALLLPWRGPGALRRFALAHLPVAAVFLAWTVPIVASGTGQHMGWLDVPGIHHVLGLLGFYADRSAPLFFVLAAAGVGATLWARARGMPRPAALAPATVWALAPIALALVASRWVPCFHERYLLYVTPALALALALAFSALGRRARAAAAVLAVAALGVRLAQLAPQSGFAWRSAADRVRGAAADAVVLAPDFEDRTFAYYFDRAAFRDVERTGQRLRADGVLPVGTAGGADALPPPGARRIVLVEAVTGSRELPRVVRARLAATGFTELRRDELPGVAVTILAR